MKRAIVTWIVCPIAGTATAFAIEYSLRDRDMSVVAPVAQGVGLWIGLMLAYPIYYRRRPDLRYDVWRYTAVTTVPTTLVTAARIALQTG
jgi:hypothetical protein